MTTEALAQKSRTLHLGDSLAEFMGQLGLGRTGGSKGDISRLRDQIKRVAGSSLTVTDTRPNLDAGEHFSYISKWRLWWTPEGEPEPAEAPKIIVLSEEFYEDITNRGAVPVDLRVLRALRSKGGGAFPIDVYTWLTHRLSYQRGISAPITWAQLAGQFGSQYGRARDFKPKFLQALAEIQAVYPEARVKVLPQGVQLIQSGTSVPLLADVIERRQPRL